MRHILEKHLGKSAAALSLVAVALGYALGVDPNLVEKCFDLVAQ